MTARLGKAAAFRYWLTSTSYHAVRLPLYLVRAGRVLLGMTVSKRDRQAAVTALRTAQAQLDDNATYEMRQGITEETPTYLLLNRAVNDALGNPDLPWWHR